MTKDGVWYRIPSPFIGRAAESPRLIPRLESGHVPEGMEVRSLANYPPPERWAHWEEYDAKAWPGRKLKQYALIPTTCFNCEAVRGRVAYVDKSSGQVRRFEGNPYHPASRGRNCAKGRATINRINGPGRIPHPLKRVGTRGGGQWQQVGRDEALNGIAARIRKALTEERHNE